MTRFFACGLLCIWCTVMISSASAEQHMMQPRVPADKLAEARSLTSPLPDSPETVEKGKALYNGKGTCFTCHGKTGAGDGPVAARSILLRRISSITDSGGIAQKERSSG